jgi:hypothetical protein
MHFFLQLMENVPFSCERRGPGESAREQENGTFSAYLYICAHQGLKPWRR